MGVIKADCCAASNLKPLQVAFQCACRRERRAHTQVKLATHSHTYRRVHIGAGTLKAAHIGSEALWRQRI